MAGDMGEDIRARLMSIEGKLDDLALKVASKIAFADLGSDQKPAVVVSPSDSPDSRVDGPWSGGGATAGDSLRAVAAAPIMATSPVFRHAVHPVQMQSPEELEDLPQLPSAVQEDGDEPQTRPSKDSNDVDNDADGVVVPRASMSSEGERQKLASRTSTQARLLRAESGSVQKITFTTTGKSESKSMLLIKNFGVTEILARLVEAVENQKDQPLFKLVHSTRFQLAISLIILLQGILVGYGASNAMGVAAFGASEDPAIDILEMGLAIFFICELAFRIFAERICFLFGPEWKWNYFDSTLVILSLVDMGLNGTDGGQMASATVGRILRLSRFAVLMRISRVMRQLPSLRLILLSILNSMMSLIWCFLFITFIMYAFAVLFVYGAAEFFKDGGAMDQPDVAKELIYWWGSIYRSMVTLFMCISGGTDWEAPLQPLRTMSMVYEYMMLFYIFFMCFGVLNVVVGAFVATTQQIAERDREAIVQSALDELDGYTSKIKSFFKEADIDRSGTLSWEEFSHHLEDPRVKAYFQALQLDVSQAHILFDLLDTDGSNSVTVDEFVDGCVRLRGSARSIDLNMLVFMCQRTFRQVSDFLVVGEKLASFVETSHPEEKDNITPIKCGS